MQGFARITVRCVGSIVLAALFAGSLWGQATLDFENVTTARLSSNVLSTDIADRDFASGDFDGDGDTDLAVMRHPAHQHAGLPDVLLMNVNGVLTDQTALYAMFSTVAGSSGFGDSTCDVDVKAVDVTGDGLLDLVTATCNPGVSAKYITHPRVYVNRGVDAFGQWLGFSFDDANRIPTMPFTTDFVALSAGDIDNDGDQDLIFGSRSSFAASAPGNQIRLLVNSGTGYFTDETALRYPSFAQYPWSVAIHLADMNADGLVDIVLSRQLHFPDSISVLYNATPSPGYFLVAGLQTFYTGNSWSSGIADLDQDGLPDVVVGDDNVDSYVLNTGPSIVGGATTFAAPVNLEYSPGLADEGFCGNVKVADFNADGLPEVVIADVDIEISGTTRHCDIFRNRGAVTGSRLIEELTAPGIVYGIPSADLMGTYDTEPIDVDGDGLMDLVIARGGATTVWRNRLGGNVSFIYPFGRPNFQAASGPTTVVVDLQPALATNVIDPSSVLVWTSVGNQPFVSSPATQIGPDRYSVVLPSLGSCFDEWRYYFSASFIVTPATVVTDPPTAPVDSYELYGAFGVTSSTVESFETTAPGWTVVNGPLYAAGAWQLAVPNGTTNLGVPAAPSTDSEAAVGFTRCFVTQNGPVNGAAGAADVDGGPTSLVSPPINLAGIDAIIGYDRWFYGSVGTRSLVVQVTGDGVNWVTVETVFPAAGITNAWVPRTFRVGEFISPTATVRVRFTTQDLPNTAIVEAGIDRFTVDYLDCTTCQPDLGYGGPGTLVLSLCGGNLSSGTTAELLLTGAIPNDVAYLGAAFTADLIPIYGGTLVSPNLFYVGTVPTDAAGEYRDSNIPGGLGNVTIYLQAFQVDGSLPELIAFSNIIEARFLP